MFMIYIETSTSANDDKVAAGVDLAFCMCSCRAFVLLDIALNPEIP